MNKRIRQYIGLFCAILAYYCVHEGAHFIYALMIGVFKKIHFIGLGMQIDVYAEKMSNTQMGIFCLLGALATLLTAYLLVLCADKIGKSSCKNFKAIMYYITIVFLLIDPLYLSVLCGLFGGGDMNGISLLVPAYAARIVFGILLIINVITFIKIVLPKYKATFQNEG